MTQNYTDKQRVDIAQKEYKKYGLGESVDIDRGKTHVGYVSEVHNDSKTGCQAYIVTDQKADKANADPNSVKEVTVLYQGSGNPTDEGFTNNVKKDWMQNDLKLGKDIAFNEVNSKYKGKPTPQLKYSSDVLNQTLEKYPNAKVYVYGHSLGSMNGQYALANVPEKDLQRVEGYLYEGPNIYSLLNPKQQDTVNKLNANNQIYNYIDLKDLVVMGYDDDWGAVGKVKVVDSKLLLNPIQQHSWGGYQFDKHGNLKLSSKDMAAEPMDVIQELQFDAIQALQSAELTGLDQLETKLKDQGTGSLTESQKLFLNASEALIYVNNFHALIQDNISTINDQLDKYIKDTENDWNTAKKKAKAVNDWFPSEVTLNDEEIEEALHSGGCTKNKLETEPIKKYKKQQSKLNKINTELQELTTQIVEVIQHQVQSDQELAAMFLA